MPCAALCRAADAVPLPQNCDASANGQPPQEDGCPSFDRCGVEMRMRGVAMRSADAASPGIERQRDRRRKSAGQKDGLRAGQTVSRLVSRIPRRRQSASVDGCRYVHIPPDRVLLALPLRSHPGSAGAGPAPEDAGHHHTRRMGRTRRDDAKACLKARLVCLPRKKFDASARGQPSQRDGCPWCDATSPFSRRRAGTGWRDRPRSRGRSPCAAGSPCARGCRAP